MKRICEIVLTLAAAVATASTMSCRGYDVKIFNQNLNPEEPVTSQTQEESVVGYHDPNTIESEERTAAKVLGYSLESDFRSVEASNPIKLDGAFRSTMDAGYKRVDLDENVSLKTY